MTKRDGEPKEEIVKIRVTEEQKKLLGDAALTQDIDLSTWLRQVGLREARKLLDEPPKTKRSRS